MDRIRWTVIQAYKRTAEGSVPALILQSSDGQVVTLAGPLVDGNDFQPIPRRPTTVRKELPDQ